MFKFIGRNTFISDNIYVRIFLIIKHRFNLIWKELWNCLKIAFCLWCYYPTYKGALLIDQKLGKIVDSVLPKIIPVADKILGMIGVKRGESSSSASSAPSSRKHD